MKIGILGCGAMAETFAGTLRQMEEVECRAAASRTLGRAQEFAQKYGFEKAYGSYEELCGDPEIELIYIATPHSSHYENMELCIRHKKPVLCEKAFTVNADEAERIQALSEQENVFTAEAIWTRYMPSRHMIQEIIDSGVVGNISALTANLSYPITHKERIMRPELESITIFFRNGRMAVLTHDIYGRSDRKGIFYGEKGYIIVENINNPQSISVYDTVDRLIRRTEVPEQISGYEYEVLECMEAVRAGERESRSMPLADSITVMKIMDQLRGQWGLVYPKEQVK